MWDKKMSFKLTALALFASSLCSCATAEPNGLMSIFKQSVEDATPTAVTNTTSVEGTEVTDPLLIQQMELEKQAEAKRLEEERKAEEERIRREKQQQAENKLQEITGSALLHLKSAVAKLYADNQYALLWQDKEAERQFLREYAAMVMSGISRTSATILSQIDKADPNNTLLRDILLTDAFLDYMYYSNNVSHSAQKWLYAADSYKPSAPKQADIDAWVSAAKNGNLLNYVNKLSSNNKLYKQTIAHIKSISSKSSKGKKSSTDQIYKLAINAQRLRVIPNFENGLFVNIPSYQLQYYRDGKVTLTSRVIVGKDERRTPVMYSKLSNVVVNPPWNTPTRLANEDLLPKIRKDPGYLARNGYELIDSKGNIVNPAGINWSTMTKLPYRLRQKPSDNTALGRYKFNMPSSDAIYLHDTPSRGLFAQKNRALSSGCVRVEKSDELATILLKEVGWSAEKKQNVLNSRKTTSAPVKSNNPVYLYYVTAWVDNNKVQTLPDIYNYDKTPDLSYINWGTVYKYL